MIARLVGRAYDAAAELLFPVDDDEIARDEGQLHDLYIEFTGPVEPLPATAGCGTPTVCSLRGCQKLCARQAEAVEAVR